MISHFLPHPHRCCCCWNVPHLGDIIWCGGRREGGCHLRATQKEGKANYWTHLLYCLDNMNWITYRCCISHMPWIVASRRNYLQIWLKIKTTPYQLICSISKSCMKILSIPIQFTIAHFSPSMLSLFQGTVRDPEVFLICQNRCAISKNVLWLQGKRMHIQLWMDTQQQ